ncbi:beta strand repeat-containing protein [Propionicimonas paludicola]|uniref:beta strand repeat-containing protein n=1 Tax=Propionicimonas paludicola TaxID=185243 RepID=UPI001FEA37B3|nr:Ig-like domain-containing protein [Propionicimonas paludicola]
MAGITALALAGGVVTAVPAQAAGSIDLSTVDLTSLASSSGGAFSVSGPTATDDLTISGDVTLTGTAPIGRTITISGGTSSAPRQITLQAVTAHAGADSAAIQLAAGAFAKFTLVGTSGLAGSDTRPGLGIPVGAGAELAAAGLTGRIDVTGTGNAAAIGGDGNAVLTEPAVKPITITGLAGASCGTLTISGGTINALIGSDSGTGAAIGGGRFGSGCTVNISGGVVNATGKAGAGIGGGIGKDAANGYLKDSPGGAGGNVTISGGTVTATSAGSTVTGESELRYSAAIGGGRGGGGGAEDQGSNGAPGTLIITGGSVKLSPRLASDLKPDPKNGPAMLAQVKVNNAASVSQVVVTPEGGVATPFAVSSNHPSDAALYLYLPYPKTYSIAVTAGGNTTTYRAVTQSTGADATAYVPAPDPAKLSLSGVTFEPATWGYSAQAAQAVTIQNTGGTAATITGASVSPSGAFTVDKPATVSVPAGGSNSSITVTPVTGLAAGVHEATLTLTSAAGTLTTPLSFTVNGVPELALTAPSFPNVTVGAYTPVGQDLTITNTGSAPATLSSVTSSSSAFAVATSSAAIQPGGSVKVKVTPAAGLAVGNYQSTITANFNGRTATAKVSLTVAPVPVVDIRAGQTTLTLVKGSSVAISAYGYLANGQSVAVTWSVSNAAVATVSSSGSIKGINAGKATVTATSGGKSTSISITVLAKKSKTKVKSVSGSVPKTMKVGARAYVTGKYSPTSAPSAKVTYSSSSKSVVTVDAAGALTAKKKGKASITIKAGGKSKKYTVTVK